MRKTHLLCIFLLTMNIAASVVVTIADTNTEMKVATTTTVKIKSHY